MKGEFVLDLHVSESMAKFAYKNRQKQFQNHFFTYFSTNLAMAEGSCCLPGFHFPVGMRHSLRWLILAISLLAFTLLYANNITFNFSVICIIRPSPRKPIEHFFHHNHSQNDPKGCANSDWNNAGIAFPEQFYYDYTMQQRNLLFSAAALGAICSSVFITQLIAFFGIRS
jgi:hypothetical protein